jgi:cation:H+ antiporter
VSLAEAIGLILGGLVLLAGGGETLVRGSTAIARRAGLSPAVIGLTIVAAATSLPELVVSVLAALGGEPEIAVGNVVGSNIFNIVGVVGITALIATLPVHGSAVKYQWPFMFLVSCVAVLFARDGVIGRLDGGILLLGFVGFTSVMVRLARREVASQERRQAASEAGHRTLRGPNAVLGIAIVAVVGGLMLLVLGGSALVSGAVELARLEGISERVIGLTIVAIGTSMPEVATSVVAALRGRTDVAIANLIGANIFNILGALGITALLRPTPVPAVMLNTDMVWMLGTAFVLFPAMRTGMRVTRLEGGLLLLLYGGYLLILLR